MIVLPILLYPLLMIGLTRVTSSRVAALSSRTHEIAIEGAGEDLARFLHGYKGETPDDGEAPTRAWFELIRTDATEAIESGYAAAGVRVDNDFEDDLEAKRTATLTIVYDNTEERSVAAAGAISKALDAYRDSLLEKRLADPSHLKPFIRERQELSGVGAVSVFASKVLGLLVVLMTLTACFYPAVDLAAGEKERGTLETLLVSPVDRSQLVLGKYLAVVTVAIGAAVLNLAAMALTFSQLALALPGANGSQGMQIGAGQIGAMLLLLVPLCALFGAGALALSAFARSYKEGLHYLTPLAALVTPLAVVASLPAIDLDVGLALVPVTGTVLLFRDLLLGHADLGLGAISFASTALFAALLLSLCVRFFQREEVLFRPVGIGGLRSLRDEARRRGHPTAGEAFLLFTVALSLLWFVIPLFATSMIGSTIALQLLVILAPVVVYAAVMGYRRREVFPLARASGRTWTATALFVLAGFAIAARAAAWLVNVDPEEAQALEKMFQPFLELPFVAQLALIALLPAICEETFFRGFVLRGLRTEFSPWLAAAIGGLMFGAMHLSLAKMPGTTLLGLLFGIVVIRSGSILPVMVGHFVHNALALLVGDLGLENWIEEQPVGSAIVAFVGGGIAIAVGLRLLPRTPAPDAG